MASLFVGNVVTYVYICDKMQFFYQLSLSTFYPNKHYCYFKQVQLLRKGKPRGQSHIKDLLKKQKYSDKNMYNKNLQ